jgi:cell division protein FtsQ
MSSVAAPSDRRFRRAHVKPSRRRGGWRAFALPAAQVAGVALLVAVSVYRLSVVAAHAHVLEVDRIVVKGNDRLSKGEVLAVLTGLRGESLLKADLDSWRQRLLASPWVRDAALKRSLPSTVEVVISERQPIGIGRIDGDMYLVDERGSVIDQFGPQYSDLDLPIIDGFSGSASAADKAGDEERADLAMRVITGLRPQPDIARRLSQIDVSDPHDAAVLLTGDAAVLHLGDERFLQRLQGYIDLSPALHERVPAIDYVDLRFDERIYVRPSTPARAVKQ